MLMQRCPLKAGGDFHMHRLGVSPNCVHHILKVSSADWLSLESEGVTKESVSRFLSAAVSPVNFPVWEVVDGNGLAYCQIQHC